MPPPPLQFTPCRSRLGKAHRLGVEAEFGIAGAGGVFRNARQKGVDADGQANVEGSRIDFNVEGDLPADEFVEALCALFVQAVAEHAPPGGDGSALAGEDGAKQAETHRRGRWKKFPDVSIAEDGVSPLEPSLTAQRLDASRKPCALRGEIGLDLGVSYWLLVGQPGYGPCLKKVNSLAGDGELDILRTAEDALQPAWPGEPEPPPGPR